MVNTDGLDPWGLSLLDWMDAPSSPYTFFGNGGGGDCFESGDTCDAPEYCGPIYLGAIPAAISVSVTVTISGSTNIPLAAPGSTEGINSTQLTVSGSPRGGSYSWRAVSGDANIAIANATSATATIYSVAEGTFTVQVTYTDPKQRTATASAPGRVQKPAALLGQEFPFRYDCSGAPSFDNYLAYGLDVQYEVTDSSNRVIPVAGMPANETFSNFRSNCAGFNEPPRPHNSSTLSDGKFAGPDSLFFCSESCLPADSNRNPTGSCTATMNQTWTVNGYPVRTNTLRYTCQGITVTP